MFENGYPSLADISAVTNNDSFGGSAWIWVLLIFAIFGWGGNGFGNKSNTSSQSVYEGYVLQNDFSQLSNKLDTIGNGIASLGYDLQAQNNNINQNVMQTGFGLQSAINTLSSTMQNCCCQINNNVTQQGCETRFAIQSSTRDIIDNNTQNSQRIIDLITTNEMQSLRDKLSLAQFENSQNAQTNYIISKLPTSAS